jgi:hypothetical protein
MGASVTSHKTPYTIISSYQNIGQVSRQSQRQFHIPERNLGASPAPPGTGLYACIFFACGKKGYRFYPLRCGKTASLPFYRFEFLRGKNS